MSYQVTQLSANEEAMLHSGQSLALLCQDFILSHPLPIIIFLCGQLGAGKTTLTRGFLRGLGVTDHIKSPTYTLVESYALSSFIVHHFDLYRVKEARELTWLGLDDYFTPHAICLIEWPEIGMTVLPASDITCTIVIEGEGRRLQFSSHTKTGDTLLRRFDHGNS